MITYFASEMVTEGIRVQVQTEYLPEHSDPSIPEHAFCYTIRVSNESVQPARLLERHWIIKDRYGNERHERGIGVIGEQPRILPGQAYEYTSCCPLSTPQGSMRGSYQMLRDDGTCFDVAVSEFFLFIPSESSRDIN